MTQDDLILCAFRYCLGRATYIVWDMCRYLEENWNSIHPEFQKIIIKEIIDAERRDCLGWEQDKHEWLRLLELVLEAEKRRT